MGMGLTRRTMTDETRTEYTTEEQTYTVTVCDICDCTHDTMVELSVNPEGEELSNTRVIDFTGRIEKAKEYVDNEQHVDRIMDEYPDKNLYGMAERTKMKPVEAVATFDVCVDCLKDTFGLDLPDDYDSVNVDATGITVFQDHIIDSEDAAYIALLNVIAATTLGLFVLL